MILPAATPEVKKILDISVLLSSELSEETTLVHIFYSIIAYPFELSISDILDHHIDDTTRENICARFRDVYPNIFRTSARSLTERAVHSKQFCQTSVITKVLSDLTYTAAITGKSYITMCDLLLYLLDSDVVKSMVNSFLSGNQVDALTMDLQSHRDVTEENGDLVATPLPNCEKFGVDLTSVAASEELDPTIGRNEETAEVISILCRRRKNNPILVGDPGVGKTAIIEGLAQRVVSGEVPEQLRNKRIFMLDLAAMVAGTQFRGQFEERVKDLVDEIADNPDVILFIDEIHTLIGSGSSQGSVDGASMLKSPLSRGTIQCIGCTTHEEYRKQFEKDLALARRFQKVTIEEPSDEETKTILAGIRDTYTLYHKVNVPDELLDLCIHLSNRIPSERSQPDRSIDILDEALSEMKLSSVQIPEEIIEETTRVEELEGKFRTLLEKDSFHSASEIKRELDNARSNLQALTRRWRKEKAAKMENLTADVLYQVAGRISGIPISKLSQDDAKQTLNIGSELKQRVIGQDAAIDAIAKALQISRCGLKNPRHPMGVFLFLGPTGVGKTHIARELAKYLFHTEKALIRENMSELAEQHSGSRLIGSPPGYVGYDEGGSIINDIRERPYSVVLLDEIEKADTSIFNLLLQAFDEGTLKDGRGKEADLRNCIIIMTSNLGGRIITEDTTELGFHPSQESPESKHRRMEKVLRAELKKKFAPEFLNRLSEIVVFSDLSREQLVDIVPLLIDEINESTKNHTLSMDKGAATRLVDLAYEEKMGARPLNRAIEEHIKAPIAKEILARNFNDGDTIYISTDDAGHFTFSRKCEKKATRKKKRVRTSV